mmetsp:Transcript_27766/g.41055  ORF Transcript_27766/g.41055 Transcript_27766/m.41055 type:complete len:107 (+) Transcript_27766:1439-1759(+)
MVTRGGKLLGIEEGLSDGTLLRGEEGSSDGEVLGIVVGLSGGRTLVGDDRYKEEIVEMLGIEDKDGALVDFVDSTVEDEFDKLADFFLLFLFLVCRPLVTAILSSS